MNLTGKTKYLFLIIALIIFALPVKGQETMAPVILTWSTNTYTPIDYPGKALPVLNSKIEVAATIDSSEPEKLFYTWTLSRNYYLQEKITKKGKQTFDFNINSNYIYSIEVIVRDDQDNVIGKSTALSIKPVEPQIVLKADNVSTDVSDFNFKKYQIVSDQSLKFTAIPYFFNIHNLNELDYNWKFDNQSAEQSDNFDSPNVFNLKIGKVADTLLKNIRLSVEGFNTSAQAQLILTP